MSIQPEFDRLLSQYLEGEISADELAALENKLLADDEFAEHVSRWCLMHRQIAELLSEHQLHQLMDQFIQGSPTLPKQAFVHSKPTAKHLSTKRPGASATLDGSAAERRRRRIPRQLAGLVGVAALLIVATLGVQWANNRGQVDTGVSPPNAGVAADAAHDAQPRAIATLTRLVDGVWQTGAPVLHHGQLLNVGGRVALRSGMAKVTFDCGAEVMLEGPCDFEVRSPMEGILTSGKLTADVPRRAFRFSIRSPGVDFVDLGTSFGVAIGGKGKTELHVFNGEVLCSQTKSAVRERNEIIHVMARKAVEFNSAGGDPSDIAMNEEQFSGLISLRRPGDKQPRLLTRDELALWLSADTGVTTDSENRVISWQDIVYGDNQAAEDAIQADENARPALVPDVVNGHAVVRFDGQSDYLLTTPLETTDDQTVFLVCQFSQSAFDKDRVWGGQILNYDGPPSRYLSNTLEPGVLQIGEPLLENEFKPTLLTGQVFGGFIGSATVESGRVDAVPVGANVPFIVSYLYDYANGRAVLSINGKSYGEARAFAPQEITSRKIIGRHAWMQLFFHGDLAEVLIYNQALSSQQLADTTTYLAEKYSITLDAGGSTAKTAAE
jgi:anti-sigma factor RsiW